MKKRISVLMCMAVLMVFVCLPALGFAADKKVTLGGKNFTEQYLLPALAKALLEKEGFEVEVKTGLSTALARKALEQGEIDVYYEYTGTAYTTFFKQKDPAVMNDPDKVYTWVKEKDADNGLVWLDAVQFNNTYTLMMNQTQAGELGVKSISDLAEYVKENQKKLIFGLGTEFWERPDGFRKMAELYGLIVPPTNIKKMSDGLAYQALKENQINVGMGFATDGRIAAFKFVNLDDDKKFFPVYNPAPVIKKEVIEKYPEISTILKPLADNLSNADMQELNKRVDVGHEAEAKVAQEWLKAKGLL